MSDTPQKQADWYFDFISPFAYFQFARFHQLPTPLTIDCKPVLFAGLLGHWEHKGPAEIPEKRRHTYRYCKWFADRNGIAFTMPPAHPFNPLPALRLAVALDGSREAIATIFDVIFGEGRDVASEDGWAMATERLGLDRAEAADRIADPSVKTTLRTNTEEALSKGVFGVPTFEVDGELFWGVDATEMLLDYLADPNLFTTGDMVRISDLPIGQARKL